MKPAPAFVLAGPDGAVIAEGIHRGYPRLADARAALAAGDVPILVGALPFDVASAAALWHPESVRFSDAAPPWSAGELPTVRVTRTVPEPDVHRNRIEEALSLLGDPRRGLHKVVLARALHLHAAAPLDARVVARRLATADATANTFLVDLSAAGGRHRGTALVGASPELLVDRRGETVRCRPFAGSAPRLADPDADAASGAALAESAKNQHEHQLVIDEIRKVLDPLCVDLQIAPAPQLSRTAAVWHLSTPITGRLRETTTTALDLALALHPTPAVGGAPADAAAETIRRIEGDRGFYAGAVGWCDAGGDGRWVVSIRCAELSADRRDVVAHAGGGIVAESDPDDEVAETTTKFTTMLTALGVQL
ncbi:isochorismate synthase [Mycolicibacterium thermoresistibile]